MHQAYESEKVHSTTYVEIKAIVIVKSIGVV